jgi:protein tyrosine phosphatase
MVWEQGSVVIVTLTKLSENGTALCHRYWPEEGSELHHIYEVSPLPLSLCSIWQAEVFLTRISKLFLSNSKLLEGLVKSMPVSNHYH